MNAVVDTNVVASFLLGTEAFVEEARHFMTALDDAWALVRAHETGIAVYDTLFVELAVREALPLVTFDGAVQTELQVENPGRPRTHCARGI